MPIDDNAFDDGLMHTQMMKPMTRNPAIILRNIIAAAAFAATLLASAHAAAQIPACAGNVEAANIQEARVEQSGAVIFDDGHTVHPEGILLPAGAPDHSPDALVQQTLGVMSTLLHDKPVTIAAKAPKLDRYGRIRAQIFLPGNAADPWLQVALLKRGLARVSILPDRRECAPELLAAEAQARSAKLGLWAYPAYVVRTPQNVSQDAGTFQVVEGKVATVNMRDGRAYLDFGSDWNSSLSVTISPDDMANFRQASVDPRGFAGKNVRVRGWVEMRNGPEIAVAIPESIEIIPDPPLRQSQ